MTTDDLKSVASLKRTVSLPVEWGKDEVSAFLISAEENGIARFANRHDEFHRLIDIDAIFRSVTQILDNSKEWFEAFFFLRSHSAYLATIRLLVAGQVTESYATARQSIEFALYGYYLFRHKNLQEIWLSRTENKESRQKVRDTFKTNQMFAQLNSDDPVYGKAAKALYERTIDYGAHPNEQSVTTTMRLIRDENTRIMQGIYLHGDDIQTQVAAITAAQVGVTSLNIFRNVFRHRYDIAGITETLDKMKCEVKI